MSGKRPISKLSAIWIALVVAGSDWLTKYLIHRTYGFGESHTVWRGFFDIVHVRNFGSAFGLFNEGRATAFNTWFFAIAALVALGLLMYLLIQEDAAHGFRIFCLGLLLGGLLGNQAERFLHGYVTDFLDFYINGHHWPAFNVADSAISCGIVGYMLANLRKEQ